MSEGISSKQLAAFNKALGDYARYNRRELGPLIESRAKRMRFELFRQYRAIAPSKEKIEQEAAARGYAIKRRKGKGGKALSVKQEIAARKRSIGWLSRSWIFQGWRSARDGQDAAFIARAKSRQSIGRALVRTAKGLRAPKVTLTSFLEGAVIQNRRRALVGKAMQAQVADMRRYVARKQQAQFLTLFSKFTA